MTIQISGTNDLTPTRRRKKATESMLFNSSMTRNALRPFRSSFQIYSELWERSDVKNKTYFMGTAIKFYWHLKYFQFINVSIYSRLWHVSHSHTLSNSPFFARLPSLLFQNSLQQTRVKPQLKSVHVPKWEIFNSVAFFCTRQSVCFWSF